jgi:hypothetical protein
MANYWYDHLLHAKLRKRLLDDAEQALLSGFEIYRCACCGNVLQEGPALDLAIAADLSDSLSWFCCYCPEAVRVTTVAERAKELSVQQLLERRGV